MDRKRLDQQFDFIKEIDKEKFIQRQTRLSDNVRRENDAEHAWHMAIMTVLLSEYTNEKIDVLRTVTMLLIHDIVEIDAGDTYAYDEEGLKTQRERECQAADRIYALLPEDQQSKLRDIWEEFEAGGKICTYDGQPAAGYAECGKQWCFMERTWHRYKSDHEA